MNHTILHLVADYIGQNTNCTIILPIADSIL
jgi:hypothetical protein